MKPLSGLNHAKVLAITLGFIGASCATQMTPAIRLPAPKPQILASKEPNAATTVKIQAAYGKLPLSFEANQGQINSQVKFLSRGSGYSLFLTSTEAVLQLRNADLGVRNEKPLPSATKSENPQSAIRDPQATVLRMQLVGANPAPQVVGLDQFSGKSNYFIGNNPEKWHTDVPLYARVQYRDLYPGVDVIYYGNQRQLEYDFVVAPGADPATITLAFAGADKLEVDAIGDLVLHVAGGDVRLKKPLVYQEVDGARREVAGDYRLSDGQVSFQVGDYDATRPLVIDPVLTYATYIGSDDFERGYDIAVAGSGQAYVVGQSGFPISAADFPVTAGAFDTSFNGGEDAFVAKLNATGSALVYSTYLGGNTDSS